MKFGTHIKQVINYLQAKFHLTTSILIVDFETRSEKSQPQLELG